MGQELFPSSSVTFSELKVVAAVCEKGRGSEEHRERERRLRFRADMTQYRGLCSFSGIAAILPLCIATIIGRQCTYVHIGEGESRSVWE